MICRVVIKSSHNHPVDQHQIYGENFKLIDHMTISVLCKDSSSIRVLQLHILKSGKAEGVSKCINPSLEPVFFI